VTDLQERIVHESLKLFSLKGFLSTSVNDIIESAGTSKGGFYNHFASKEDLFYRVLAQAQRIWRDRVLFGLDDIESPTGKVHKLLVNYRDRYLKDGDDFPGGCVFVTLSVELDDQLPHLCEEVNRGFSGLKRMLKRLLEEGKEIGELAESVDTGAVAEMIFVGMLGSSVVYGVDKSTDILDRSIGSLLSYIDRLRRQAG
jgi:TetR/AcrR family transcriptional repressor of nem operon